MTTMTNSNSRQSNSIRWGPFIWILLIHLGSLLAFVPAYFSWDALLVCVLLHWLTGGIGICMAYHRLLTHRSYTLRPRWLEYVLTAVGAAASEGDAIGWVADHRRHHAHSDTEEDTHSPLRGFAWAHMFWWLTPDSDTAHTPEYLRRWAPDLYKDPVQRWMARYYVIFPLGLAGLLYAVGGMPYLVWGFFVRSVLVLHSTWLVNSAAHIWGYRTYQTRDKSTNLWWVAAVSYGEGWHNNHHAFQTSARHGLKPLEFDPTYWTIKLLEAVGIAYNVKMMKHTRALPKEFVPGAEDVSVLPIANPEDHPSIRHDAPANETTNGAAAAATAAGFGNGELGGAPAVTAAGLEASPDLVSVPTSAMGPDVTSR